MGFFCLLTLDNWRPLNRAGARLATAARCPKPIRVSLSRRSDSQRLIVCGGKLR